MNFRPPRKQPGDGRDPRITQLLRAEYLAPQDPSYWQGLESRVMARVTGARPTEWWDVLAQWSRAGLLAAGLAAAAALAAARQTRAAEARVAYEVVAESPPVLPSQRAAYTAGASEREAALRYVTAY
jgi:hypothetical protein